jgi:hypothetical protein
MSMKQFLFILFCCFCTAVQAQDLTGIWRGSFRSNSDPTTNKLMELMGADDRYKFEVQIDQKDKTFGGVTYSYKTTVFYGKATCSGTINPATRKVYLEELKIVEVRMSGMSDACVMTLFLQYSRTGDEEFLEGNYTSMNTRDSSNCGRGTVFLRKVVTSDFYKEPFLVEKEKAKERQKSIIAEKKNNPPATNPNPPVKKTTPTTTPPANNKTGQVTSTKPKTNPKSTNTTAKKPEVKPTRKDTLVNKVVIAPADTLKRAEVKAPDKVPTPKIFLSRENELVKVITTGANEVELNIYDNGTVDNDTISVYLDKKLVLQKKRLTESPLTLKFKLDENVDEHELVMVAENLGEIPPNTSLMVVTAGGKRYEVRITSTEQKNAVVLFRYEKGR